MSKSGAEVTQVIAITPGLGNEKEKRGHFQDHRACSSGAGAQTCEGHQTTNEVQPSRCLYGCTSEGDEEAELGVPQELEARATAAHYCWNNATLSWNTGAHSPHLLPSSLPLAPPVGRAEQEAS